MNEAARSLRHMYKLTRGWSVFTAQLTNDQDLTTFGDPSLTTRLRVHNLGIFITQCLSQPISTSLSIMKYPYVRLSEPNIPGPQLRSHTPRGDVSKTQAPVLPKWYVRFSVEVVSSRVYFQNSVKLDLEK